MKKLFKNLFLSALVLATISGCSFTNETFSPELNIAEEVQFGAVPSGIKFLFAGTNAEIPTNWSEDLSYSGKYVLGADTDANGGTDGGQATHTHNIDSHTHTFASGASSGSTLVSPVIKGVQVSALTHTHPSTNSNAASGASGTASNDPPYHEFIVIEPDDALQDVPAGIVGLFDETLPTGWTASSTLADSWPKGVAAGQDAGTTGGTSDAHTHTTAHAHAAKNSLPSGQKQIARAPLLNRSVAKLSHVHSVALTTGSLSISNGDALPPYRDLIPATNPSDDTPVGIIGLWDGAIGDIPSGWERVIAQDNKFLRLDTTVATGGADTHAHAASGTHVHGYTAGTGLSETVDRTFLAVTAPLSTHSHTWTIGNTSAGLAINISKSNYPEYRTTIFIKFVGGEERRIWFINYHIPQGKEEELIILKV